MPRYSLVLGDTIWERGIIVDPSCVSKRPGCYQHDDRWQHISICIARILGIRVWIWQRVRKRCLVAGRRSLRAGDQRLVGLLVVLFVEWENLRNVWRGGRTPKKLWETFGEGEKYWEILINVRWGWGNYEIWWEMVRSGEIFWEMVRNGEKRLARGRKFDKLGEMRCQGEKFWEMLG